MTAAIKVVTYEPEWEPPDLDELKEVGVEKAFLTKVEMYHVGLKSLSFKGIWKNEDGADLTQPVCSFKIQGGGTNKIPGIKPAVLAQLVCARAQDHANELGEIVKYKVTFYGDNEDMGGTFQRQGTFKIDGRPEEEEEAEDEPENPQQIVRGADVKLLPHAAGPAAVLRPSPESEMVQLMRIHQQHSAGLFSEIRASMTQQRIDMTSSMQAQREDYRHILGDMGSVMDGMRKDAAHARGEVDKANARLIKMSDQSASHFRGQQEANQAGWEAFRAGMQMQLQAMSQSMSWERQVMFMNFDQVAKEKQKEERPKWIKDYGPLILAGVGQVMAATGSPAGEKIMELAMEAMDDDDEDDESEEATPSAKGPVMGVPDGEDPGSHFEKNKLSSMLQLFNSMLSPTQHESLKELLPEMAYNTLQTAMRSKNDALSKAYVIQFSAYVKAVDGLDDKLTAELTEEQQELFRDIGVVVAESLPGANKSAKKPFIDVETTTPKSAPPPPPAPPAAPSPKASEEESIPAFESDWRISKLKAYAKKHYGLGTWPTGTKKKDVIKAIEEAQK